jgi:hypothetical protein
MFIEIPGITHYAPNFTDLTTGIVGIVLAQMHPIVVRLFLIEAFHQRSGFPFQTGARNIRFTPWIGNDIQIHPSDLKTAGCSSNPQPG